MAQIQTTVGKATKDLRRAGHARSKAVVISVTEPEGEKEPVVWVGVTHEMAREVLRQGETYLAAQLTAAIAADQRSTSFAAALAASATAVFAGAVSVMNSSYSETGLAAAGFVTGALFLLSAYFCLYAARPIPFYYAGNHPEQWHDPLLLRGSLVEAIIGQSENAQVAIGKNASVMSRNGRYFKYALFLTGLAPIFGILTWLFWSAVAEVWVWVLHHFLTLEC